MHRRLGAVAVVAATLVPGCAADAGSPGAARPSPSSPTPRAVRTVVRTGHAVHVGQTVRLAAQRGVALRLTAAAPHSARTRLSSSHGYPPAHGLYLTFRLTIANVGRKPVLLGPGNFVVAVQGEGRVTSYDGNAPYSGAPRQLDTTQIAPGEVLRAPLTFDVRRAHGRLLFVPDSTAAVTWVY